jgi:hypothetical protein
MRRNARRLPAKQRWRHSAPQASQSLLGSAGESIVRQAVGSTPRGYGYLRKGSSWLCHHHAEGGRIALGDLGEIVAPAERRTKRRLPARPTGRAGPTLPGGSIRIKPQGVAPTFLVNPPLGIRLGRESADGAETAPPCNFHPIGAQSVWDYFVFRHSGDSTPQRPPVLDKNFFRVDWDVPAAPAAIRAPIF